MSAPRTAPAPLLRAHRWLYDHSDGRIGHGMIGAPSLLLRTTGRRSGRRRCTALCYIPGTGGVVLAASNDGADRAPAWFHNLVADPRVEVQVGRRHLPGQATVIDPAHPDHQWLWPRMNAAINGRLDAYQARTRRSIPLIAITFNDTVTPEKR